jgi:hypothetical protein
MPALVCLYFKRFLELLFRNEALLNEKSGEACIGRILFHYLSIVEKK